MGTRERSMANNFIVFSNHIFNRVGYPMSACISGSDKLGLLLCSSHGSIATVKDAAFVAVMVQLGTNDCLPASQPHVNLSASSIPRSGAVK